MSYDYQSLHFDLHCCCITRCKPLALWCTPPVLTCVWDVLLMCRMGSSMFWHVRRSPRICRSHCQVLILLHTGRIALYTALIRGSLSLTVKFCLWASSGDVGCEGDVSVHHKVTVRVSVECSTQYQKSMQRARLGVAQLCFNKQRAV